MLNPPLLHKLNKLQLIILKLDNVKLSTFAAVPLASRTLSRLSRLGPLYREYMDNPHRKGFP